MALYFELAQGSSIRLCPELEKECLCDLQGWPLELMMDICLVAYDSEVYYGVCEDAWLRTTIDLKGSLDSIFPEESSERVQISQISRRPKHEVIQRLSELLREPTSKIKIHSNVLPCELYRQKLAHELERQSVWTRVQSLVRRRSPGCVFGRGFDPIRVFDEAQKGDLSLMQKRKAWRRDGGRCGLATLVQSRGVPFRTVREAVGKTGLRQIRLRDVQLDRALSSGSADGDIHKVSWHKATYVRKKFNFDRTFKKERNVAWRVLHPLIVHSFGYFDVPDVSRAGSLRPCLLMEMLDRDLHNFLVQKAKSAIWLPLSLADALDILLQIASAVEHLHSHGIVHGDLKPQNILISDFEISGDDRHFLAKVTDFGNVQFITENESLGFESVGFGTPRFAAPERLAFRDNKDLMFTGSGLKKMDVYSFGGVAYEVLTGQAVHDGKFLSLTATEVASGRLRPKYSIVQRSSTTGCPIDLLERCWEFDPSRRPSFEELRIALETSQSNMQRQEKISAALWNFIAVFFACFMIYLLLCLIKFRTHVV